MKKKIFYCVSLFVVVSITQFYLPDLGIAGRYNIIGYQDNETERINHPHLCAQIGGNTSNFVIAQQPASGDIKDESMKNFLKIDDCHTAADGSGIVVMVIDIPVDYRHDIFDQDGYSSLSQENCYLIECDYENNIATQIIPAPIYTGDFVDNFNAYYSGPELIDTDMYHGTAVAGLVKQIAPYSTIISMGPLVAIGDELKSKI